MTTDGGTVNGEAVTRVVAPAKLTVSLRVTGVRPDGYHELDAEMVTLDLADESSVRAAIRTIPRIGIWRCSAPR